MLHVKYSHFSINFNNLLPLLCVRYLSATKARLLARFLRPSPSIIGLRVVLGKGARRFLSGKYCNGGPFVIVYSALEGTIAHCKVLLRGRLGSKIPIVADVVGLLGLCRKSSGRRGRVPFVPWRIGIARLNGAVMGPHRIKPGVAFPVAHFSSFRPTLSH